MTSACAPSPAVLEAVNLRDVRIIQRRQHFSLTLESCEALRIRCEGAGRIFERYVALEPIARAIHLAHAAGADQRDDFVGAERAPGGSATR